MKRGAYNIYNVRQSPNIWFQPDGLMVAADPVRPTERQRHIVGVS